MEMRLPWLDPFGKSVGVTRLANIGGVPSLYSTKSIGNTVRQEGSVSGAPGSLPVKPSSSQAPPTDAHKVATYNTLTSMAECAFTWWSLYINSCLKYLEFVRRRVR
jgi:hypothetical protein